MGEASAKILNARISLKHSLVLCKLLKGKRIGRAKRFLQDLIEEKISVDGKHYTKAASKFLELLESLEANAKQKGLNVEKLFIKVIKADKGLRFRRPRSLWHLRGHRAKAVHLSVEAEER